MSRDVKSSPSAPKSRSERRREDTRRRLMKATFEMIAKRGPEALIIQDITEAADVGYGSFYNHFTSKEAIIDAVVNAALERSMALYEQIHAETSDRVEAFALELRCCLEQSRSDPVWGWFVIRTMLSWPKVRLAMGERLRRSIEGGIKAGAFTAADAEMARHTVGGLLLLGTLKTVNGETDEAYPSRLVQTALETLGVAPEKIRQVLGKPLPDLVAGRPFLDAA